MSAANPWAATAVAPPSRPLRLARLDQTSREARHLSLAAAASPRRSALRSDRCPPALSCLRGDSVPTNTGSGGIHHDWDWNRWSQHFSEIDQTESFSSLLKVSAVLDCSFLFLMLSILMVFYLSADYFAKAVLFPFNFT